ncbi:penicillin-binding protein 2 [Lagierella sp.]|uniref:peptidoglycan D,D-transpeptidase FtsI family protein n=1 Tax=Lagierella sp. TaxID=2849657 RepID=UPI002603CF72|nr:penicillin-binding protein 2 [Lagierella sp.]
MERINKKIIVVFCVFVALFLGLVLYMTYFQIVKAKDIATGEYSQYNRRHWVDENKVKRGTIYDSEGNVLVETQTDSDNNNFRKFTYGSIYSPITGFNSKNYGTSGLEKSYAKTLLNIKEDTPLSELKKLVETQEDGNNLVLTTNSTLQAYVMKLLKDNKGSIVVMNPKTGKIYAMASYPTFDPNTITSDWQDIVGNEEEARLINRATQGLYTPGSVFKVVTATGILENQDKVESMTIEDEGSIKIGGYKVSNINGMVNGETDLKKALVKSSNVYFSKLGSELGQEILSNVSKRYLIGEKFSFDLPTYKSKNGFYDGIDKANIATTSFGQGNTLVTPLNMAMVMSAIANEGVMMQPYIVDKITNPQGEVEFKKNPEILSKVTSPEIANEILRDMVAVVENGSEAGLRAVTVAGKSGTAEIKDKKSTNAWFIATAPAKDPSIAVAVVLEDSGTGGDESAGPIARETIRKALNLGLGN